MKIILKSAVLLAVLPLLTPPHKALCAGFSFADPRIPAGELATYECLKNGSTFIITEKVAVRSEAGRPYYAIESQSPELDAVIVIARDTMTVGSVSMHKKFADATIKSTLTMIDEKPNPEKDQVKLPHFIVLKYLLRGFPFSDPCKLKIGYYGDPANKKYSMSVSYKHTEEITVKGRAYACHKLEFGLDGVLGALMPEIELWYSAEPPHYLVRYAGVEGLPGSPKRIIELRDYEVPAREAPSEGE